MLWNAAANTPALGLVVHVLLNCIEFVPRGIASASRWRVVCARASQSEAVSSDGSELLVGSVWTLKRAGPSECNKQNIAQGDSDYWQLTASYTQAAQTLSLLKFFVSSCDQAATCPCQQGHATTPIPTHTQRCKRLQNSGEHRQTSDRAAQMLTPWPAAP